MIMEWGIQFLDRATWMAASKNVGEIWFQMVEFEMTSPGINIPSIAWYHRHVPWSWYRIQILASLRLRYQPKAVGTVYVAILFAYICVIPCPYHQTYSRLSKLGSYPILGNFSLINLICNWSSWEIISNIRVGQGQIWGFHPSHNPAEHQIVFLPNGPFLEIEHRKHTDHSRHCPWLEGKDDDEEKKASDTSHGCFFKDCTGKAQRLYFGLESWRKFAWWWHDHFQKPNPRLTYEFLWVRALATTAGVFGRWCQVSKCQGSGQCQWILRQSLHHAYA